MLFYEEKLPPPQKITSPTENSHLQLFKWYFVGLFNFLAEAPSTESVNIS